MDAAIRLEELGLGYPGFLWSSNFRMAYHTMEIIRGELSWLWSDMRVDTLLEPRLLGAFDKKEDDLRLVVWQKDAEDPTARPPRADPLLPGSAESAQDVYRRVIELITKLETGYQNTDLVLISHCDVLSVMHAALIGEDIRHHREFAFDFGEVRLIEKPQQDVYSFPPRLGQPSALRSPITEL
eukprot:CAMPEP_0196667752 /NCGR_PEP_ID=MMETSP1086-20130531/65255_1 /TAXON_ID=77921 /ORGANISM="Cyanoptyche  gloeocystis , Strain SAG4.97" /LENGTH=182 /DNA_ID=CAMNT_0042005111 /DNA_START=592 /DNA_END=1140 /DNA_ORIENTATION=-